MLKKIISINSAIYAKALLNLDHVDTIQLVAENNVGKSSLINTLNFLYMVDRQDMHFEGARKLKDSLSHYFPHPEQSYLLFELQHQEEPYTLLVKRGKEQEIHYYRIASPYLDELFFRNSKLGQTVVPFSELLQQMDKKGMAYTLLQKEDLYWDLYGTKEEDQPLMRLASNAGKRSRGYSNHFTKMYRHLIKSSRITEEDFVEAMLRASHTEDKHLTVFADHYSDSLGLLTQKEQELALLREIEPTFVKARQIQKEIDQQVKHLGMLKHTFMATYEEAVKKKKAEKKEMLKQGKTSEEGLRLAQQKKEEALQQKGGLEHQWIVQQQKLQEATQALKQLNAQKYPLQEAQWKEKIKELEFTYYEGLRLKKEQSSLKSLKSHIKELEASTKELKTQIECYDDALIHHLSDKKEVQRKLSEVLHPKLLYGSKKWLKEKVNRFDSILSLFDGAIDVSHIKGKGDFIRLEELKKKHAQQEEDLAFARQMSKNQEALDDMAQEISRQKQLLAQLQAKPILEKQYAEAKEKVTQLKEALQTLEKTLEHIDKERVQHAERAQWVQKKVGQEEIILERWSTWRQEIRTMEHIAPIEHVLEERNLSKIRALMQEEQNSMSKASKKLHPLADALSQKLRRYHRTPQELLASIEKDIDSMPEVEKACKELLEGVINHYVGPTRQFLDHYYTFKAWVEKFSQRLTGYHISGLDAVQVEVIGMDGLINDLERISAIRQADELDFEQNQTEAKTLLQAYIKKGRTYTLSHLFQLSLKIKRKDGSKTILRIDKQMESYGTDKMLRLFIFLHIIKELVVLSEKRRLVMYVDEVGTLGKENIQKIVSFAKEHHILPIFASTDFVEGFDRYYPLKPSPENNNKVYIVQGYETEARYKKKSTSSAS